MNSDFLSDKNAVFESQRLVFRGISAEDAAKIVEWRSNGKIVRYFFDKTPLTMEKHLKWFESYLRDRTRYDFIITEKINGEKAGTVGLQNLNGNSADISYLINTDLQGKGYGTEAIRAMSSYAFEHFNLKTLTAVILTDNAASRKAAERAGYRLYSQTFILIKPEREI